MYYNFQKDLMLQKNRLELSYLANEQLLKLKDLHVNFDKNRVYPRDVRFNSAIYDSSKKEIFSTFSNKHIDFNEVIYMDEDKIYLIKEPESYYLGTKYLVLEVKSDSSWHKNVYKTLSIYGAGLFLLMVVFGYFLLRLLLKPMREAIELLDRFIKDTTHELNTPVNAIMSNIEMIDTNSLDEKLAKKIKRIDIGARTVSNLYQDLTYLTLAHKIVSNDEDVNLQEVIEERIEYFTLFAQSRKIDINCDLEENISLHIDRKKITKLIDNLLSNAVKYNKIKGTINIRLQDGYFEVHDSGRGIAQEKIDAMFERYTRADESVGGFGIGLSIVHMIAEEYTLHVKITSKEKKWTKVRVSW
ncbi:sensor histidine kinase [Sulfurospirillum arcachonense]|uniref:sensor histidine kinase n=1 Tax=Sulfurospirillum arcachonense TaxID=57666 RepID=UPI001FDEABC6|nr:HAMP domain-containing sensor histidine kinase [Sulfurospirillum arcachonense]